MILVHVTQTDHTGDGREATGKTAQEGTERRGGSTWLAAEGMMLVQGKEVNRRDSKAGLVSQAATSSPPPSITPLYMLAIAGLQTTPKQSYH